MNNYNVINIPPLRSYVISFSLYHSKNIESIWKLQSSSMYKAYIFKYIEFKGVIMLIIIF